MPLQRNYTMIQITYEGRALLRALAYRRHKPMYEALDDVLREAAERQQDQNDGKEPCTPIQT